MLFWTLASALTLAVLAVLVTPLLRPQRRPARGDHRQLNLSVHRQQLRELQEDRERDLIAEDQLQQAQRDIERAVLEEIPVEEQPPEADTGAAGRPGPLQALLVCMLVVAVSLPMYFSIGHPETLQPGEIADGGESPSVEQLVRSLEQRLEENPEDNQGWLMLGQAYLALGRYDEAVQVLRDLNERVGNQPVVLVHYAQALAMANDGSFAGTPGRLVQRVLELQPGHPTALWFAGLAARERGELRRAIDYWQQLLPQLGGEPEAQAQVKQLLAETGRILGIDVEVAGQSESAPVAGTDSDVAIRVQVSVSDRLQGQMDPDDTLFVFARAPTGMPMPLAVVRRRAGELPLEVVLDDSQAMSPQRLLSGQEQVTLVARISPSGNARPESGDLQGELQGVPVTGTETVPLVIDTTLP